MPGTSDRTSRPRHAAGIAALGASAIALLLAAGSATAALYKWVDANGRVTYSDQPPPGNVKAEIVGSPPPANPAAVRELASQEAEFRKQQTQRAEDQKKAAKTRADEAQLRQSCADVRAQLKVLLSDQALVRMNEQGETVYVDDAMRLRERERIEALIRERCSG